MIKKLFCIVLIIFVLTACNSDVMPSSDMSGESSVSSTVTEKTSSTDNSEVVSVELTPADDTSSDAEEILDIDSAFDAYLKGKIPAIDDSKENYVYQHTRIGDGKEGIDDYALYDVTGDGVPELHLKFMGYEILMYQNGVLVTIYESGTNFQHGPICLLENGAMLEEHTTFETMYTYTTFNADGTSNEIEFDFIEYPEDEMENNSYRFEGRKVTKQEFDELTKEYFEEAEKKIELDWIEWTPQ